MITNADACAGRLSLTRQLCGSPHATHTWYAGDNDRSESMCGVDITRTCAVRRVFAATGFPCIWKRATPIQPNRSALKNPRPRRTKGYHSDALRALDGIPV